MDSAAADRLASGPVRVLTSRRLDLGGVVEPHSEHGLAVDGECPEVSTPSRVPERRARWTIWSWS